MRLKLVFYSGLNAEIPINYNHFLTSAIYSYLAKDDKKYSSRLHGLNSYKFFTFSWLQVEKKKVERYFIKILSDKVLWYISSPSKEFINTFANGLMKIGYLQIGSTLFELQQVEVLPEVDINSEMRFICLSPIVVTTKKYYNGKLVKYYYKPEDDQEEIAERIKNNLIKKYESFYNINVKGNDNDNAVVDITFNFDQRYLPKAKVLVHYVKGNLDIKIPAIMCPFAVKGNRELIKFGYECGFGELNSAGFGMVKTP
jgi:CRISPR-associated endoribonuclease Cas6